MIGNLLKAAVGVAVTPVAVVVDILTLPASAEDPARGAFGRTEKVLKSVGENIEKAVQP